MHRAALAKAKELAHGMVITRALTRDESGYDAWLAYFWLKALTSAFKSYGYVVSIKDKNGDEVVYE